MLPKVYPGIKVWGPVFSSYRASFFIAWVSVSLPTGKDRLCFPVLWQAGIQKGEIERTASRESGRGPRSGTQAGPRQRSDSTCWRPREPFGGPERERDPYRCHRRLQPPRCAASTRRVSAFELRVRKVCLGRRGAAPGDPGQALTQWLSTPTPLTSQHRPQGSQSTALATCRSMYPTNEWVTGSIVQKLSLDKAFIRFN